MKYKINLFPTPKQTFLDRIIYFSFNYLRYILVITQLVVVGVFTFRFTVDQEIVDLKDKLKQKQDIVQVSSPLIKEGVIIDNKIKNVKDLLTKQKKFNDMLAYYLSVFPEEVVATSITIDDDQIILQGNTSDPTILQSYYNRLKKDQKFKDVQLRNLQKSDTGFTFSLSLKMYVS